MGRDWVWAVLGGAVAVTAFAAGGVWLLTGTSEDATSSPSTPTTAAPTAPAETAPPSPVAVTSQPAPTQGARCWDGSVAASVGECSLPEGAAGLAWLFPQVPGQQCRPPKVGGPGVVVRVLCSATLSDGTPVQVGYYQWDAVATGRAYYDAQQLNRREVNGFDLWTARLGQRTKKALLYADAPYSRTLVYRTSARGNAALQHLQPRPPDRVRGEPLR